ncbi:MAG: sigma 54-interacting transcriptional regulator [Sporomusaceae bacterium]|nr:sigma 54-interacting transcriptional regulator [Sporomusaceae bacterium]
MRQEAVIRHSNGLHARVAAMVVQKAHELQQAYQVDLFFHYHERERIPAGSLLPLIGLRVKAGDAITVAGCGRMAGQAVEAMCAFLESDFLISDADFGQVDAVLQNNAFMAEHIFNNIANGLIVIDENNIITVFNPAAARLMNIQEAEAVGRHVCDVIPNTRLHLVNKLMLTELGSRQEIGRIVLLTNRTPIVVDGQSKGAIAIFEDISSLEAATGELREVKQLKEHLHLILESVQDGICVVDRKGCISYVNEAYTRLTQTPRDMLLQQHIATLSPLGARAKALLSGRPVQGNISRKPNGRTLIADVNPILVDGAIAGVVSVVKDLSEVQTLLDELSQATARAEYLERELARAKKPLQAFKQFIGQSGLVLDALAVAAKAAAGSSTVLILGESGTGKELVAEGIHFASARAGGPFIRVNCAAIPAALLESELFGHEKGAFTGAVKRKLGSFELADNGSIFLDEIGDLEKSLQVKLLRVLQKKEFQRLGGEATIKVDVRIIAATNRNLEKMVASGEFREDLYYRLNIIPVLLPPLRQRKADIPLLIEHFLKRICEEQKKKIKTISPDALQVLLRYRWPGNVRELENMIERLVALAEGAGIGLEALPAYMREAAAAETEAAAFPGGETILSWDSYEKWIVEKALARCGSFNKAAKALGLTHKTVAAKARKYGLTKKVAWEK